MLNSWRPFLAGVSAISPVLIGIVPFGLIYGTTASAAGLDLWVTSLISVSMFAGASQIILIQVLGSGGAVAVAIITALALNARMLMYSAGVAPSFEGQPSWRKVLAAYLLTDQAFAIGTAKHRFQGRAYFPYYLGAALAVWTTWQIATIFGAVLGKTIPPDWELSFAIPLTFLSLIASQLRDRIRLFVFVVAGSVSTAMSLLPFQLNIIVAAILGMLLGSWIESRIKPSSHENVQ